MLTAHKIGTKSYLKDSDKVPTMLRKGKIALLPPRGGDRKTAKQIVASVRRNKEAGT
jgi:hypothetical protein